MLSADISQVCSPSVITKGLADHLKIRHPKLSHLKIRHPKLSMNISHLNLFPPVETPKDQPNIQVIVKNDKTIKSEKIKVIY